MPRITLITAVFLFVCLPCLAQRKQEALTDQEIELIRENAIFPDKRIAAYQEILDDRIDRIADLVGKKYQAGKIEDLHNWMQQVADIAGELEDNLEAYKNDHRDLRKVLPKLIVAAGKWSSVLNQVEKNGQYEIVRQFAIDSVSDVQKEASELLPAQKQYFKEHPPQKEENHEIVVER